ncbi:hypothetical protein [Nocardioides sp.]|uniref:hypothetical protein n=1 Tax=Nocardioides sp. TaxID=35761 RepID=UPI002B26A2E4|nr:hypothetical protein [Nocardioides sp.]
MNLSRVAVGALTCLVLAGCGDSTAGPSEAPFTLPVGSTEWDVGAPAWFHVDTLHVGEETVRLGKGVDEFVLGATGVYWVRSGVLMFTDAEGASQEVADVGWTNLAVSADRSVLATVDQSHGPTDRYGTRVIQLAVFDTTTGEQLYRTPDEEPDRGDDLADLYSETMPLLDGVSDERAFFDDATIDLADGSATPLSLDDERVEFYEGYAETLFHDGYRVNLRVDGARRMLAESSAHGTGLLSPDRSTIFDTTHWPTDAVAYDATTGRRRAIDAPWEHFTLAGWSDEDTFFGVAEQIDENQDNVLQAQQVVTCKLRTLACTPASPVIAVEAAGERRPTTFLLEGSRYPY